MKAYCSPNTQDIHDRTQTCYTLNQLRFIGKRYNINVPTNSRLKLYVPKKVLLESLIKILKVHESKWYSLPFMRDVNQSNKIELKDSFKPIKPTSWTLNEKEWLNTNDIMNVMTQYEDKYHSFKFLGVHPMDFADRFSGDSKSASSSASDRCVSPVMCNFSVKDLLRAKKTQCGVVLNIDYHDEPGSHWVSLYIGLSPRLVNFGCFYIDSTSSSTPIEVVKFMNSVKQQIEEYYKHTTKTFVLLENKKQIQFKNTECGMFSIYFLLQFLQRKNFKQIVNSPIDDDKVHRLRNEYFLSLTR